MRNTNKAAIASKPIISMLLSIPPIAPPRPRLENKAPRPRPSKAPPSMPFQGLGGFAATALAPAAAAGAGLLLLAAELALLDCNGACRVTCSGWLPNGAPPPQR